MAKFKNANSASVSFGLVKKKVMSEPGETKVTPKKAAPTKRKKEAIEAVEAEDSNESPFKKAKYTVTTLESAKKQKTKKEDEDEAKRDLWPYSGI